MKIAVGVVLYNFNIDKINLIIKEYCEKVEYIILVDNGSTNITKLKDKVKKNDKIIIIENNENKGVAKALNQLLEEAYTRKMDYLLTLDQDSFLKYQDLLKMTTYMKDNIAIICPEIIDMNKKKNKFLKKEYEQVDRCITSGSLMNLKACSKIGKFDEKMFIDYVDFDYSKRAQLKGNKILKIKGCFLKHEIGKRTTRKFLGIYVYPTNHSSVRVYYYFRNMHYYYLKFRKEMTYKEKINEKIRMAWKYISIILYENNKLEKVKCAKKGYIEALKML